MNDNRKTALMALAGLVARLDSDVLCKGVTAAVPIVVTTPSRLLSAARDIGYPSV